MTEFVFPTQQSTDELVAQEPPPRSRATLMGIGLVAALALVTSGYAGVSLLAGHDPAPTAASTSQLVFPKSAAPTVVATPKPGVVPVAYTEHLGRDPFKPLYVIPVVAVAAPGAAVASGDAPLASPGSTYAVKLTGVTLGAGSAATSVAWVVSGAAKTVLLGQRFGLHGELVVLSVNKSPTGPATGITLQVGDDQPAPVTLGQTISVL